MTRKAITEDKFAIIDRLSDVSEGRPVSRFLLDKLANMGYISITDVRKNSVGRPAKKFELTGKAKGFLAISKTWKRPEKRIRKKKETS